MIWGCIGAGVSAGGFNTVTQGLTVEKCRNSDAALRSGRVVPHPAPPNVKTCFFQNRYRNAPTSKLNNSGYSEVFGG